MHKNTFSGLLLVAAFGVAAVPASAGIVFYNTQGAWQTALGSTTPTFLDFSAQNASPTGLNVGPILFAGGGWVYEGAGSTAFNNLTPPAQYVIYKNSPFSLTSSSASNLYALAFYVGGVFVTNYNPNQQTVTVTSTTGQNTVGPVLYDMSVPHFYGIISDAPITSVFIDADSFQNLTLGSVQIVQQQTPEAATLVLIGTGLGLIASRRRYQTQAGASA
jgi:hypothetical protein